MLPKKKILTDSIITMDLTRHGEKNIFGKITDKGKRQSFAVGRALNPNERLKRYTSPSKRAQQTIEIISDSFKGSNKMSKIKNKKELNENNAFLFMVRFLDAFRNLVGKGDGKVANNIAKLWMENKISRSIILPPEELAIKVVKKRIGVVVRYLRIVEKQGRLNQIPKTKIVAVTHAGIIMPVYESLTSKKYFDNYKKMPKSTESLKLNFLYDKGKLQIFMIFRKESHNVTKKVHDLLTK